MARAAALAAPCPLPPCPSPPKVADAGAGLQRLGQCAEVCLLVVVLAVLAWGHEAEGPWGLAGGGGGGDGGGGGGGGAGRRQVEGAGEAGGRGGGLGGWGQQRACARGVAGACAGQLEAARARTCARVRVGTCMQARTHMHTRTHTCTHAPCAPALNFLLDRMAACRAASSSASLMARSRSEAQMRHLRHVLRRPFCTVFSSST